MQPRLYLSSPHMSGGELPLIHEAFAENWIAPLGPHVDAFEAELAAQTAREHCAVLSSGTAALHLALILFVYKRCIFVGIVGDKFASLFHRGQGAMLVTTVIPSATYTSMYILALLSNNTLSASL